MGKIIKLLFTVGCSVMHATAFAHTFSSMTEYTPPENLNSPVGVSDDGRVVGKGDCEPAAGGTWCLTSEGEITLSWTPENGIQTFDWGYESVLNLDPDQSVVALQILDTSASTEIIIGSYAIETQLSPTSSSTSYGQAFRWNEVDGFQPLGSLGAGLDTAPQAISADGETIVGFAGPYSGDWKPRYTSPLRDGGQATRWTPAGGLEYLGIPSFAEASIATLVSPDGGAVAGMLMLPGETIYAYHWTEAGGVVGLGDLPGGETESRPVALSADGNVVVGYSKSALGYEPFHWDSTNGMTSLGFLPTSEVSFPTSVSADGSVIVGRGTHFRDGSTILVRNQAWIWTSEDGMQPLGSLPGGDESVAWYVSPDGSTVIGTSDTGPRTDCSFFFCFAEDIFIWTEATGMLGLRDILYAHGFDMFDWDTAGLGPVISVSPNGRTIAVGAPHIDPYGTSPYVGYADGYGEYARGYVVQLDKLNARIDVDPWSPLNPVDPDAAGTIPVAIMGRTGTDALDSEFDVSKIDSASLKFGDGEAMPVSGPLTGVDFDSDTHPDVVYGFDTFDSAIACLDTTVTLTGVTIEGDSFSATDSIETVNCSTGNCHP